MKFNGVDAGAAVSWSNTSIKVKVPYGAETGNVTVITAEGSSNGFPFTVGLSNTYYFAEGTTRANFEEWLCLMNPNDKTANVQMLYMLGDGTTKHFEAAIPKKSRMTLYVADVVGPDKDVSTKVTSDIPIVAERPMYFSYGGAWTGGHDVIGAIAPAQDWYFAEGNTRDGFEEWLCLQNPNAQATNVDITYMLQGGQTVVQSVSIPATSRKTISVNAALGPNKDCSAKVHADKGIIAERPMYFIYKPGTNNWTGGHDVVGANAPGKEWYFAEGTTRPGFDEWLCLQNPGNAPAQVTIQFMLESGQILTQIVTVDAKSRKTLDVNGFVGPGRDVSMHVTSDQPIVAERPMYFNYVGLTGGHDVIGATCSSPNWYFAEGATQNGFQEWMSLQNPGDTDATVFITYMLGTGKNVDTLVQVKAHSRTTVDVNGAVGWGQDVSARVRTTASIIVERPMYFDLHGWTGGHDVVGFHY